MKQNYALTIQLLWKIKENKLDELSYHLHISTSQISRYLNLKTKIPVENIDKILKYYGYNTSDISNIEYDSINNDLEECFKHIHFEDKDHFLNLYNQLSCNENRIIISGYYIAYLLIQEKAVVDGVINLDFNDLRSKIDLIYEGLNPDSQAFHHDNIGVYYMHIRLFEKAYKHFKTAEALYNSRELRPLNHYRLASAAALTRRYSECMHYANLAMNAFAQEMNLAKIVRLNIMISAALDSSGENEKAINVLKQCIYIIDLYHLNFAIYQLQDTIFNLYVEMKDYEKALVYIQSYTLQDALSYYCLALVYYDLLDLHQAKKTLQEAQSIQSSLPEPLLHDILTFVQSIIDQEKKKKVLQYYKSLTQYDNYLTPSQGRFFKYIFLKYYIDDEDTEGIL